MRYYVIHLPLGISKEFVYSSKTTIVEGSRVLVTFGSKLCFGICGAERTIDAADNIRYKAVEEVLDTHPVLPTELLQLAHWIAMYYHCSEGKALFAMLPARLQPELNITIRWIAETIPEEFSKLHAAFGKNEIMNLSDLRIALPNYSLYRRVEEAEYLGLIEVERKLNHKDKPRTVNFIHRCDLDFDPDSLPLKQREAWEVLRLEEQVFPLANITSIVSYSAIKGLVKKGVITIQPHQLNPESLSFDVFPSPKQIVLNQAQLDAIAEIACGYDKFNVHLLYGITGSGKTEVYIEVIRRYLSLGKSVIFLIPEIALSPQMVERFQSSFGNIMAIQHSQLTDIDRFAQWKKIASGEKKIIIGARSAIFAPVPNLGLIVVDEEHEGTYKQDNNPRYNGRDLAIVRAKLQNVQVVLGSATPALESWNNALSGKYKLLKLESRPLDYKIPTVELVDLRDEYESELISPILLNAIEHRMQRKEQVILFQNRRGYSSFMQCLKCGKLITCNQCEISMSYHRDREEMQCHYCGSTHPSPRKCPACGSYSFSYGAPGTQKLEQILKIVFPEARILRMDSDSARKRDTYKSMYNRMKKRDVDILLGTQMISKGLDFPDVTLVGIVMADISLNVPDFRAAERTFQLLTQVAGRSGRAEKAGEVIIQTYNPEHYAISAACRQDFLAFAQEELGYRRKLYYPPFYRLARILFQSLDLELLKSEMGAFEEIKLKLGQMFYVPELLLLGPSAAPFSKISNYYRFHLIFKGMNSKTIQQALKVFVELYKCPAAISYQIDVDPMSLM
ncbi:MAG: primosomal protein N' [Candidatus Cloacimonas sp.]|jgi:primosomal protein N' (replication factor Y)|nr:primosomal protein N' [Candidatus Cloacimonas sp.]